MQVGEERARNREWEQEILLLVHLESRTLDGVEIALRANQSDEASIRGLAEKVPSGESVSVKLPGRRGAIVRPSL